MELEVGWCWGVDLGEGDLCVGYGRMGQKGQLYLNNSIASVGGTCLFPWHSWSL